MNGPPHAIVRPRIVCPETGDAVRLDEYVELWLSEHESGAVEIVGSPGSGKSTALARLKESLEGKALLLDDASCDAVAAAKAMRPVIYTTASTYRDVADISVTLSGWGRDDLVEYLLAAHSDRCGSVMARVAGLMSSEMLRGCPELWAIVLERMAADENATDLRTILRRSLIDRLPEAASREAAEAWAFACLVCNDLKWADRAADLRLDRDASRLLRHRILQRLLAADYLRRSIDSSALKELPLLPRDLVIEAGEAIRDAPPTLARLRRLAKRTRTGHPAMAASLLFAADPAWQPKYRLPHLAGGYFAGANWSHLDLTKAALEGADLNAARLEKTRLTQTDLRNAKLAKAHAARANLRECDATSANFTRANLSHVEASKARFVGADLTSANLAHARLESANLRFANLNAANLRSARLGRADLRDAQIEEADFSDADCSDAKLDGLPLRLAECAGTVFARAGLVGCDLEYVRLLAPNFNGADLSNAWLTGSDMPQANFLCARLRWAGLADIDWEEANLRHADLRGCAFFLGSSRSGLVNSPIACEGSRTGFYTDEVDEQQFKAPEEIRKANLRGADLRGANVEGVDFYLVDLRDARYSPSQAEHFRKCGAILVDRAVS